MKAEPQSGISFLAGKRVEDGKPMVECVLFDSKKWTTRQAEDWLMSHGWDAVAQEGTLGQRKPLVFRQLPVQYFKPGIRQELVPGKKNPLFGGGRKVVTLDEVRELQQDAADSACRHHDYKGAQRIAKQKPARFARSRSMRLENTLDRLKQKAGAATRGARKKAGGKLTRLGKWIANPAEVRLVQHPGQEDISRQDHHRVNLADLLELQRELLDPDLYASRVSRFCAQRWARDRAGAEWLAEAVKNGKTGILSLSGDGYGFAYIEPAPAAAKNPGKKCHRPRRLNPDAGELEQAKKLRQDFTGATPDRLLELHQAADVPRVYTKLGDLFALHIEAAGGRQKIDFEDCGVALASNPAGTQLYCIGGDQDMEPLLDKLGADDSKDMVELGPCLKIEYLARKAMDGFKQYRYVHDFGEESGVVPTLIFDQLNCRLLLAGGEYSIESPGIIN